MDAIAEADRALCCLDRAGRGPSLATGEVHPPQTYPDGQLIPPTLARASLNRRRELFVTELKLSPSFFTSAQFFGSASGQLDTIDGVLST